MLPVEEAIVEKLRNAGSCCFSEVVTGLPNFSWGQIFVTVHRISQDGGVFLRNGYSTYHISLSSRYTELKSVTSGTAESVRRGRDDEGWSGRVEEVARRQGCSSVAWV